MSSIELLPPVALLGDFNSATICRRLKIGANQIAEQKALRFAFHKGLSFRGASDYLTAHTLSTLQNTIQSAEKRLSLLNRYETDFFNNQPYDRQALVTALLCQDNLKAASVQDFPLEVLSMAATIFDEARDIVMLSRIRDYEPRTEAHFLALVNCLDSASAFAQDLNDQSYAELMNFKNTHFPSTQTYINFKTLLGADCLELLSLIDEQIDAKHPKADIIYLKDYREPR